MSSPEVVLGVAPRRPIWRASRGERRRLLAQADRLGLPHRVCDRRAPGGAGACDDLVGVGDKFWGSGAARALGVKVYDYGVYLHHPSALRRLRHDGMAGGFGGPDCAGDPDSGILDAVVRGPQAADMSLVMVTARRLPLETVGREVGSLLQRRLRKVGGSPQDPALGEMLEGFAREDTLPPECLAGGGLLQKKSCVTFTRRGGNLSTSIAGADGGAVTVSVARSPDVCAAFFDTYLGSDPVHAGARRQAASVAHELLHRGTPSPRAGGWHTRKVPEARLQQATRLQRLALALAGMPAGM